MAEHLEKAVELTLKPNETRVVVETALAENISRHFHVGRQVLLEVFQRGFQFVGQFEGTSGRLFGDCH